MPCRMWWHSLGVIVQGFCSNDTKVTAPQHACHYMTMLIARKQILRLLQIVMPHPGTKYYSYPGLCKVMVCLIKVVKKICRSRSDKSKILSRPQHPFRIRLFFNYIFVDGLNVIWGIKKSNIIFKL